MFQAADASQNSRLLQALFQSLGSQGGTLSNLSREVISGKLKPIETVDFRNEWKGRVAGVVVAPNSCFVYVSGAEKDSSITVEGIALASPLLRNTLGTEAKYSSLKVKLMLRALFVAFALSVVQANCFAALVYTANFGDNTVSQIDENGTVSTFASGLNGPSQIVVDQGGNVFVSSLNDGTVRKFSSNGTDLGIFAQLTDTGGNELGASGMAFDAAGNLYVGTSWTGNASLGDIRKFSTNGDDLGVFAHFEYQGPQNFGHASYFSMTFDQAGNLWAIDEFFGSTYEFSPDGTINQNIANDLDAFAIAVSPSGDIYTADAAGSFRRYKEDGTILESFQLAGNPFITGLAFATDGTLLYSNFDTGEIRRLAANGADLGIFSSGLSNPVGIAFAPISAVPEPSSLALIGIGAIMFISARSRCCKRLTCHSYRPHWNRLNGKRAAIRSCSIRT